MQGDWFHFEVWFPPDDEDREGTFCTEEEFGLTRDEARAKLKEQNPEMVILKDKP